MHESSQRGTQWTAVHQRNEIQQEGQVGSVRVLQSDPGTLGGNCEEPRLQEQLLQLELVMVIGRAPLVVMAPSSLAHLDYHEQSED